MKKFKDINLKVVEWFKVFGPIALAVILAGVIVMIALGMNVGLDFAGGGKLNVKLGDGLGNNPEYRDDIKNLIVGVIEDNGFSTSDSSIRWSENDTDGIVLEIGLEYEYNDEKIDPNDFDAQQNFTKLITGEEDDRDDALITKIENEVNKYSDDNLNGLITLDESIGFNIVNGSTAQNTLKNAIWATIVAVAVILVYIVIRFTLSSGLAAIIALCHDVLVMISLTTIFRVEVNTTFIAAIVTIVGYSINATIVIFDRIRELKSLDSLKSATDSELANRAVKDTLGRSILTTITTLIVILVLAVVCEIMGVTTMAQFALPIVFGLVAGFYSSVFLSASIWVYLRKFGVVLKKWIATLREKSASKK